MQHTTNVYNLVLSPFLPHNASLPARLFSSSLDPNRPLALPPRSYLALIQFLKQCEGGPLAAAAAAAASSGRSVVVPGGVPSGGDRRDPEELPDAQDEVSAD